MYFEVTPIDGVRLTINLQYVVMITPDDQNRAVIILADGGRVLAKESYSAVKASLDNVRSSMRGA